MYGVSYSGVSMLALNLERKTKITEVAGIPEEKATTTVIGHSWGTSTRTCLLDLDMVIVEDRHGRVGVQCPVMVLERLRLREDVIWVVVRIILGIF
jgi:hypothetical protein